MDVRLFPLTLFVLMDEVHLSQPSTVKVLQPPLGSQNAMMLHDFLVMFANKKARTSLSELHLDSFHSPNQPYHNHRGASNCNTLTE